MKELTSKILLLGAQGVGKSTLALRLSSGVNAIDHITPTVGVSYVEAMQEVGDHIIKLQLWDTAGQERYKSMIPMYYRNSAGALLVYDVTDDDSFRAVHQWEAELRTHESQDLVIFVVGNKYDTAHTPRKVNQSQARAFAESVGGHFCEVSALSNRGVNEMKLDLCVRLIHSSQQRKLSVPSHKYKEALDVTESVSLGDSSSSKSSSLLSNVKCCT